MTRGLVLGKQLTRSRSLLLGLHAPLLRLAKLCHGCEVLCVVLAPQMSTATGQALLLSRDRVPAWKSS